MLAESVHNPQVGVTFQFLLLVCALIELRDLYSASNFISALPQAGHKPTIFTRNWRADVRHTSETVTSSLRREASAH